MPAGDTNNHGAGVAWREELREVKAAIDDSAATRDPALRKARLEKIRLSLQDCFEHLARVAGKPTRQEDPEEEEVIRPDTDTARNFEEMARLLDTATRPVKDEAGTPLTVDPDDYPLS